MKLVRWIFTWEAARLDPATKEPVMHAYVDGSSTPICQPRVPGDPPAGLGLHVFHCHACRQMVESAYWAWDAFGAEIAWVVEMGSYSRKRKDHGVAPDVSTALRQVVEALGRLVSGDVPIELRGSSRSHVADYLRELRADARASKPSKDTGAQATEYVYRHEQHFPSWTSANFEWATTKARITRKTPKRIFVEASTRTTDKGNVVLRTYSLDRKELESGKKSRWGWTLNPNPPFVAPLKPGWAEVLGVEPTCTLAEAKRAFRERAKEVHPDVAGGDADAFRRVHDAFEAAKQHLGASTRAA